MSELPYLRHETLDEDQLKIWDAVVSTRGQSAIHAEGHLAGPFNGLLHAPGVGLRIAELGAALRYNSSIEGRLLEITICTVGAHWHAEYEWWSHARLAAGHGVSDEVIATIRRGETPTFEHDDELVVHTVAKELLADGHLTKDTWAKADELLGDRGLFELVALCGYYTMMSFGLNAFDVPLPEGAEKQWP